MNRHISYRSGNPVLSKNSFNSNSLSSETMTIEGTVNKTAMCLVLLIGSGYYTFTSISSAMLILFGVGGFITAIITIFKKEWAPVTVPIYAILEGGLLGGISYMYNSAYDGIVINAIFITVGILLSLLMAYKSGLIKPTENFKLGVAAATGGIMIVYFVNMIMSFFGSSMGVMDPTNSSLMSIGFSLVVIVIASLNLVLDFDFIEEASEKKAPKYMEWYGAFGLLVTLIWLYLEILRLLSKLNSRR